MNRLADRTAQPHSGVSLLISLLIRYPEVASVTYCPDPANLKLTFLLKRPLGLRRFRALKDRVVRSLDVYDRLEGGPPCSVSLRATTHGRVSVLEIRHDLARTAREGLSLIVELVRAELGGFLAVDSDSFPLEEDLATQEAAIEEMLDSLRESGTGRNLIAFREEGRVLVFNR
ncbi:MAG TPA: hypothetical protein DEQ28_06545 [Clostridiales bacterium]|nr:hypothetical protein [Clostridiales bacterium]